MADGNTINASRRFFLLASAAGGGLMLSGCITPGDTTDGAATALSGQPYTLRLGVSDPGQDPRGAPDLMPLWNILDMIPQGRGTPVQGFWFDWAFARILLRELDTAGNESVP